jgi:DNA-binding NarL/FixJ family response regulator
MKEKILTIGTDQVLVDSRVMILRRDYEVTMAHPEETLARLRAEHFDLLLVCYSIPFEKGTALIRAAHEEFPKLCIVRLLSADSPPIAKPIAHRLVTVDFRPEVWMAAVNQLLAETRSHAQSHS